MNSAMTGKAARPLCARAEVLESPDVNLQDAVVAQIQGTRAVMPSR